MTTEKIIARLDYLRSMLTKYAHCWNDAHEKLQCPSRRMDGWVNEYNDIREDHYNTFCEYCEKFGLSKHHDAYDCLA